jgi:hypothetical protein
MDHMSGVVWQGAHTSIIKIFPKNFKNFPKISKKYYIKFYLNDRQIILTDGISGRSDADGMAWIYASVCGGEWGYDQRNADVVAGRWCAGI